MLLFLAKIDIYFQANHSCYCLISCYRINCFILCMMQENKTFFALSFLLAALLNHIYIEIHQLLSKFSTISTIIVFPSECQPFPPTHSSLTSLLLMMSAVLPIIGQSHGIRHQFMINALTRNIQGSVASCTLLPKTCISQTSLTVFLLRRKFCNNLLQTK